MCWDAKDANVNTNSSTIQPQCFPESLETLFSSLSTHSFFSNTQCVNQHLRVCVSVLSLHTPLSVFALLPFFEPKNRVNRVDFCSIKLKSCSVLRHICTSVITLSDECTLAKPSLKAHFDNLWLVTLILWVYFKAKKYIF